MKRFRGSRRPVAKAFSSAALALGMVSASPARADVTPPPRANVLLELTIDGQDTLPDLRFIVTNCSDPPDIAVLASKAPALCHPTAGPVRVFAFRANDLPDFFDLVRRDAGTAEASAFLSSKSKPCGAVAEDDVVFPASSGVAFVSARYAIEPGPKGGCKLRRVSASTKTKAEMDARPASSATASGSSSAAPAGSSTSPLP